MQERIRKNLSRIKYKLLVLSGKGGVGKTTVAVNLGWGIASRGYMVGILDADFHGPNIAKMLGIDKKRLTGTDSGMEPVQVTSNLKAVSLALLLQDPDQAVIWRGPMKMGAIKQLLGEVNWGDLDLLIVDSPPGTGDEPLSVCQIIPDLNGAVVVTTPQEVAILDSRKSVMFARQLKVPVVGIIENMSGFICPHCKKEINLFGKGGGQKASSDLGVSFLGNIPVDPQMVIHGDSGNPFVQNQHRTESGDALDRIITRVIDYLLKS
ncbi:MAG: P-loop NTPase [Spirochaetota bacterium]